MDKDKTMMISDLPPELETEILSKVPSKSLVELKTTCKRWYTLFNDPIFIKKKFGIAAATEEEVLLLMSPTVYSISFNPHVIHNSDADPIVEFKGKLSNRTVSRIFHCDGLILCTVEQCDRRLVVWNPCTGQTLGIKPSVCYRLFDHYALGYGIESSRLSYKILRFCFHRKRHSGLFVESEIYDFSTDSWRVLDGGLSCKPYTVSHNVSLGGNSYWIVEGTHLYNILLFDFTAERFEWLPLPPFPEDSNIVLSVVGGEKLALLHQRDFELDSFVMEIWITSKVGAAKELSWSKLLVSNFNHYVLSFFLDEESKVAVCCSRGTDWRGKLYIVGEDMPKQVCKEITEESRILTTVLLGYVPSLAHIPRITNRKTKKRKMKQRKGTIKMKP